MIDIDVIRAFDESDYPGLKVAGTFVELEEYLKRLSEVVQYARDQALVRFRAEIQRKAPSLSTGDLEEKLDEIKWITEDLVPRFFLGAFVVALWAAFESEITRLANYVRTREHTRLVIADLRDANTRRRLQLYIEIVMHQPLEVDPALCSRIDELLLVRNCLAHANGDLSFQREERRKQVDNLVSANIGVAIRDNSVVVNEAFLKSYLGHVASFVTAVLQQIHKKYPRG